MSSKKDRESNTESWIKNLFYMEIGIFCLGGLAFLTSGGGNWNGLAGGFLWMMIVPLVFIITILGILNFKRVNYNNGIIRLAALVNFLAIVFLIFNITD